MLVPPYTVVGIIIFVAALLESRLVSADSGNYQMCMGKDPDGTVVFESTPGAKELLLLFKADQVWIESLDRFRGLLTDPKNNSRTMLFTATNGLNAKEIFPQFPPGRKKVVAFSGLNSSHPFYNNILVFYYNGLRRYRLHNITLGQERMILTSNGTSGQNSQVLNSTVMGVTLESSHQLLYWPTLEIDLSNVMGLHIPRRTRLLAMRHKVDPIHYSVGLYLLNRFSLNKPINIVGYIQTTFNQPYSTDGIFQHELADGTRFGFINGGLVCVASKCVKLDRFVSCDDVIVDFREGFSYWLHHKTEMTFRLVSIGLIATMIMSSTVAISFTYSQVNKILMLT